MLNTYKLKADVDVHWGVHFTLFHRETLSFIFVKMTLKLGTQQ